MIRLLTEDDRKSVLDYLYQEQNFNIFPIGDIETFGFETDFQRVYADFDQNGKYLSIFLRYRNHAIFYSHINQFNEKYIEIFKIDPFDHLSGKSEMIEKIKPYLKHFHSRQMYFCAANAVKFDLTQDLLVVKELKTKEEAEKLYDLLYQIEEFGYQKMSKDTFVDQKLSSLQMGKVFYIEDDHKIVSTVGTTAETTKNAMVVAVATSQNERKKGYATQLLKALMDLYINHKKKDLCLFYDNVEAGKIYHRLGFETIGIWMLLDKNQE